MKRFFCILMIISILPVVLACSKNDAKESETETEMDYKINAIILEIENNSILVDTQDENASGEYRVNIGNITKYYNEERKEIVKEDLKQGDKITILFNGQVARSLPPQIFAQEIILK